MICKLELEPSHHNYAHIRFWFAGRSAGVLTLRNEEWTALEPVLRVAFDVELEKIEPDSIYYANDFDKLK